MPLHSTPIRLVNWTDRVISYPGHRFDPAVLNTEGESVSTVEVERITDDVKRAGQEEYLDIAACAPDETSWIVMMRSAGLAVRETVADRPGSPTRIKKSHPRSTPSQSSG